MTLRKDYSHDTYFEGDVIESNDTMFKKFGSYTIVMDENVSVLEV